MRRRSQWKTIYNGTLPFMISLLLSLADVIRPGQTSFVQPAGFMGLFRTALSLDRLEEPVVDVL